MSGSMRTVKRPRARSDEDFCDEYVACVVVTRLACAVIELQKELAAKNAVINVAI